MLNKNKMKLFSLLMFMLYKKIFVKYVTTKINPAKKTKKKNSVEEQ